MKNIGVMKCVQEIHSEYITVGQEYNYTIWRQDGVVDYRRVNKKYCGSYMSLSNFKRHIAEGKIILIES